MAIFNSYVSLPEGTKIASLKLFIISGDLHNARSSVHPVHPSPEKPMVLASPRPLDDLMFTMLINI